MMKYIVTQGESANLDVYQLMREQNSLSTIITFILWIPKCSKVHWTIITPKFTPTIIFTIGILLLMLWREIVENFSMK